MGTKISIIVPVYNVEEYIEKCLNSLVNQTLKEIEIIVVNDGTKDNSQKIIDKFVKKYKNVFSYIKENEGLSVARNFGVKKAKGEYIAFLDSDDWVDLNTYEVMYNKAKTCNFDVVVCNLNYVYPNKIVPFSSGLNKDLLSKKEIHNNMNNIYPVAWNKIYKKDLLKKIEFKKGVYFEDVEFSYRLYPNLNNIGVVDNYFNQYLQRANNITNTFDKRLYDYIINWNSIIEYYKKNKIYKKYEKELEYSYVRYLYATFIKRAINFKDYEEYKKAVKEVINNVNEHFPNYCKNKYFYNNLKGLYLICFNYKLAKIMYKLKRRR